MEFYFLKLIFLVISLLKKVDFMLISLLGLILGTSLVFNEEVSGTKKEIPWRIDDTKNAVELISVLPERTTAIICDSHFFPKSYELKDPSKQEELNIKREGQKLLISKKAGTDEKTKNYQMKTKNWVQDFSFGLRPFFSSSDTEWKFDIVNPKDLSLRTMVATKLEMEYKTFYGIKYRAQKVKVTLDGYLKKFWKAEIWFDTKTYNLLYYKANEGPSTPYTTITLKEIKK